MSGIEVCYLEDDLSQYLVGDLPYEIRPETSSGYAACYADWYRSYSSMSCATAIVGHAQAIAEWMTSLGYETRWFSLMRPGMLEKDEPVQWFYVVPERKGVSRMQYFTLLNLVRLFSDEYAATAPNKEWLATFTDGVTWVLAASRLPKNFFYAVWSGGHMPSTGTQLVPTDDRYNSIQLTSVAAQVSPEDIKWILEQVYRNLRDEDQFLEIMRWYARDQTSYVFEYAKQKNAPPPEFPKWGKKISSIYTGRSGLFWLDWRIFYEAHMKGKLREVQYTRDSLRVFLTKPSAWTDNPRETPAW